MFTPLTLCHNFIVLVSLPFISLVQLRNPDPVWRVRPDPLPFDPEDDVTPSPSFSVTSHCLLLDPSGPETLVKTGYV